MAVKEKKIIFFQDVTATLGDGLAWIAPAACVALEQRSRTNVKSNEKQMSKSTAEAVAYEAAVKGKSVN